MIRLKMTKHVFTVFISLVVLLVYAKESLILFLNLYVFLLTVFNWEKLIKILFITFMYAYLALYSVDCIISSFNLNYPLDQTRVVVVCGLSIDVL
jgi:hypothetical protein